MLINKDVWNKLHKSQQSVVETICKASMANSFAEGEAIQFEVMKKNVEHNGVKNMYWSEEMLSVFKQTWDEVVAEEQAKDAFFKKVYEDMTHFRNGYDLWEAYAFLPRAQR